MANREKFSNETTRKITETWTTADNYRVKVYTYHDKNKKVYWSIISECIVEPSGDSGYYFEKHSTQTSALISQKLATRYNYDNLRAAHELAVAEVRSLVASLLAAHEKEVA